MWKFINMPTSRPRRTKKPNSKLNDFVTSDGNGEWVFETPEEGGRPNAGRKSSAQETSANVRGIETPIDFQVADETNENETPSVERIIVNHTETDISLVEIENNTSEFHNSHALEVVDGLRERQRGGEAAQLMVVGGVGEGEGEGGDEAAPLIEEIPLNGNNGAISVPRETSLGLNPVVDT